LTLASADRQSSADLVVGYEQLRRRVLDGGPGGPGCALLQRNGMKGWIEACLRVQQRCVHVDPPHQLAPSNIRFCGDLVQLIAAMVLEIHHQGAIS
jgi:hypothetical protein